MEIAASSLLSTEFLRDLYTRMLLTRVVDEYSSRLYRQGRIGFVASSSGYEAIQVGSAACIEIGKDFTLPYYRDLGVVLTIGMMPYEVFRSYFQAYLQTRGEDACTRCTHHGEQETALHWGYHKHNMITGSTPVATQILHAAGIGFACKLRKAPVVTVAYCGDGAAAEPDFLEGITFAALHRLPVVFVYEQGGSPPDAAQSLASTVALPAGLEHRCLSGMDVVDVYSAMQDAMGYAREGHGPVLLEFWGAGSSFEQGERAEDPLLRCQQSLNERGSWDEQWSEQLEIRIRSDVERALGDALRDSEIAQKG